MKYYTTFEEAKKLVELGVGQTTADMLYANTHFGWQPTMTDFKELFIGNERLFPCWSLGALLDIAGGFTLEYYRGLYTCEDDTVHAVEEGDLFLSVYNLVCRKYEK